MDNAKTILDNFRGPNNARIPWRDFKYLAECVTEGAIVRIWPGHKAAAKRLIFAGYIRPVEGGVRATSKGVRLIEHAARRMY